MDINHDLMDLYAIMDPDPEFVVIYPDHMDLDMGPALAHLRMGEMNSSWGAPDELCRTYLHARCCVSAGIACPGRHRAAWGR